MTSIVTSAVKITSHLPYVSLLVDPYIYAKFHYTQPISMGQTTTPKAVPTSQTFSLECSLLHWLSLYGTSFLLFSSLGTLNTFRSRTAASLTIWAKIMMLRLANVALRGGQQNCRNLPDNQACPVTDPTSPTMTQIR